MVDFSGSLWLIVGNSCLKRQTIPIMYILHSLIIYFLKYAGDLLGFFNIRLVFKTTIEIVLMENCHNMLNAYNITKMRLHYLTLSI